MIAQDVVHQQSELCEVKRANIDDRLGTLASSVAVNTANITALTTNIASMSTNIALLKGRPAIWAAIGSAIPVVVGILLWWLENR